MKTKTGIGMVATATCIVVVLPGCQAPKAVYEWGDGRRATVQGANRVTFSEQDQDGLSVVTGDGEQQRNVPAPPDKNGGQAGMDFSTHTAPAPASQPDGNLDDQVHELQGRRTQLQSAIAELEQSARQARMELAVAREDRDRLLAQIKAEEARLSKRRDQREAEENALKESRDAHAGVLAELDMQRAEMQQLQRHDAALGEGIEQHEKRIAQLGAEQRHREEVVAELQKFQQQNAMFRQANAEAEHALRQKSEGLRQIEEEILVAQRTLQDLKDRMRDVENASNKVPVDGSDNGPDKAASKAPGTPGEVVGDDHSPLSLTDPATSAVPAAGSTDVLLTAGNAPEASLEGSARFPLAVTETAEDPASSMEAETERKVRHFLPWIAASLAIGASLILAVVARRRFRAPQRLEVIMERGGQRASEALVLETGEVLVIERGGPICKPVALAPSDEAYLRPTGGRSAILHRPEGCTVTINGKPSATVSRVRPGDAIEFADGFKVVLAGVEPACLTDVLAESAAPAALS